MRKIFDLLLLLFFFFFILLAFYIVVRQLFDLKFGAFDIEFFFIYLYRKFVVICCRFHCSCNYSEYAEIVVVRHGETEWNACGRIQVVSLINYSA